MMDKKVGVNQRAKEYVTIEVNGLKVLEHIFVWEKQNGKKPDDFLIHHLDEDKKNNHIDNLICLNRKDHAKIHKFNPKKQDE